MKKISPEGKRLRLAPLDIVRTQHGTLCVVNSVASSGSVSLVLPAGSKQRVAWYEPSELVVVARVKDLVDSSPALTQKKPAREKRVVKPFISRMHKDLMGIS